MKEAMFYRSGKGGLVGCTLCPRKCSGIADGQSGFCGVRKNVGGKLYSLVYGKAVSVAIDPVEKKPLFHFAPGSSCLSIATPGCNLRCLNCQNFEISQEFGKIDCADLPPEDVVQTALSHGLPGIAYTYTEPTVFYEYALDIMRLAKREGLYNVWVSNGYTAPAAIRRMARFLDAVNVDIKGDDGFYRKVCMAQGVSPVHASLRAYKKAGVWIEVTTLVIPGLNDGEKCIRDISKWIKGNLGTGTPLHFSAFFPNYKLAGIKPTPAGTLARCHEIAKKAGLRYVYVGNVPGDDRESTRCWKCGTVMIKRDGYRISSFMAKCPKCGASVKMSGMRWSPMIPQKR